MYRLMFEKFVYRFVSFLRNLYKKKKIIKNVINVDSLYIIFMYNL